MPTRPMRLLAATCLLWTVASCGDDDTATGTGDTPATTDGSAALPAEDEDDTDAADGSDTPAGELAAGTAVVTIDGRTWTATADIQCLDFGSAGMGFQGHADDDPDTGVFLDAGLEGGDTARVDENDDEGHDWKAGGDELPGVTPSTSLETEIVDGVARGSGVFEDLNRPGTTAEGTFEFRC